jgi:hypothetical protein
VEGIINILGALTALICTGLLYRSYRFTKARLLCYGAVCFFALSLENGILFFDRYLVPEINLLYFRYGVAIFGLASLTIGLIWEAE